MVLEIISVSTENIKPSKPTPSHLKTFRLSLLDQLIPSPYAPIILFYHPNDAVSGLNVNNIDAVSHKLESLKTSLSETLTRFHPLAGTIGADQISVNCDDRGTRFVQVKVNSSLREFLSEPGLNSSLHKLLPCDDLTVPLKLNDFVSNVQASVFLCGGISLGICISHQILDGVALSSFLRSWSATSSCHYGGGGIEEEDPIWPCLDSANTLFPCKDLWLRDKSMDTFGRFFKSGVFVMKRFVFNASAISSLKAEARPGVENLTRVEAVSAFIWKCAAEGNKSGPSSATHVVNLRRRTRPFLPESSVGNLIWLVPAKREGTDDVAELCEFVRLLRDSFSRVDDEFVKVLSGDKGKDLMVKCLREICEFGNNNNNDLVHVGFSSWCKIGFYEVDFGWGNPVWVSSYWVNSSVFMNLVMLVDTRLGNGIEAWVTMDQNNMAIMENNPQLVKLGVLVDPIPF